MAEHGGTHMDAPIHFAEGKRAADEVPSTGATLIALPMKIAKGSGAPVRIIGLLP